MLRYVMELYLSHLLVLTCVVLITKNWVHAASVDRMKITEPIVLVEEGRPAEIPCLTIGRHDAYIWMKGNSVENSTEIASYIDGIASEDTSLFSVSENGTLLINNVRLRDEGKYLCRASSEISDCTGEVMVYVQAVLDKFVLGVDRCQAKSDCAIVIDSSQSSTITCTATNAPHSMDLKWFNGSKEIKDGIVLERRDAQGGMSQFISSTLNIVDVLPSLLMCQAIDHRRINDEGLFVNVQLQAPVVPVTSLTPSPGWMVTAIILMITCLVTLTVIVIMSVTSKKQQHKADIGLNEEREDLLDKQNTDIKIKDDKIERLQAERDKDLKYHNEEIDRLKANQEKALSDKENEIERLKDIKANIIKDQEDEVKRLKGKKLEEMKDRDVEKQQMKKEIEARKKEIEDLNRQLTELAKDLQSSCTERGLLEEKAGKREQLMKEEVNAKEKEMKEMQRQQLHLNNKLQSSSKEIKEKEEKIKELHEKLQKKTKELSSKESNLESSSKEIKEKEEKIKELQEKLKEKTEELSSKESNLKESIIETEVVATKLRLERMKLKDTVQFVCKVIPRPGKKTQIAWKEKTSGWTIKTKEMKHGVRINLAYTSRSNNDDVSQAISDLMQNAIDGGSSCLVSYATSGQDHIVTMTGSSDGHNEGVLKFSSDILFKTVDSLRRKSIEVKLFARYLAGMEASPTQSYFIDFPSMTKCKNFLELEKVSISDSEKGKELLTKYLTYVKGQSSSITSQDCMVEYYISTFIDHQPRSSGKISLVALCGLEQLNQCFRSNKTYINTFELPIVVSEAIYNGNCHSILIPHLSEEKSTETKSILEVIHKVQETEGKSFFRRLIQI